MKQGKGLSRNEIIIILLIIAFLMAILMLGLRKVQSTAQQLVCGVNLKGLGTAMIVYSHDHDKYYPQLPGNGSWSKELGFKYDLQKPDFKPGGQQCNTNRTITASWYLLVREPNELDRRVGQPPKRHTPENDAKSKDDSFLAI